MRAIFLDRDGVINVERGDYTYKIRDFRIIPNIIASLMWCKNNNFLRIVATNQSGISQGIYTTAEMKQCHEYFQDTSGHLIDAFYYAPWHPSISRSLSRKPDSLMFERAIARFQLDPLQCWMVGDKERDLIPARQLGMTTIMIGGQSEFADYRIGEVGELPMVIEQHQ